MNISRIKSAEKDIRGYFDSLAKKIFLKKNIYQILAENHRTWELRKIMSVDTFIDGLLKMKLKEVKLTSPNYDTTYTRFMWGKNIPICQLGLSLRPQSYLTHHTAMRIHGLTDQTPATVYVNTEQSIKYDREGELEQGRIATAFKRKPRVSKYIFTYKDRNICCLNGINTKKLGVEEATVFTEGKLPVTNIERTLIDITVRPIYSGGCHEVLKAYGRAKDRVSVERIISMLKKIKYIYPYHQAIGFYMQTAGFSDSALKQLKKFGMEYDFYLDYGMKKTKYSKEWRIYYPKNLYPSS
jgi:predicted transcriptional regulator of viral defense system